MIAMSDEFIGSRRDTAAAWIGSKALQDEPNTRVFRKSRGIPEITVAIRKILAIRKYGSSLVGSAPMIRTNYGAILREVTSAVDHDHRA
jgi:hypothetical protein